MLVCRACSFQSTQRDSCYYESLLGPTKKYARENELDRVHQTWNLEKYCTMWCSKGMLT